VTLPAVVEILWPKAVRIIPSRFPPIDLFEDIADPRDWPLIMAAEQKTNPRLVETIGALDRVPPERRVGGLNASYLMAPFTHASPDRPGRFSVGLPGVLYAGDSFEVALAETVFHYGKFMARTNEAPGWASQFREIVLTVEARLHDLRGAALDPSRYDECQALGEKLRAAGSDGVVYQSVRWPQGQCVGLFYPDCAKNPAQGRHLEYHWDGQRVDLCRELRTDGKHEIIRVIDEG
jgi:hypothetical protein